MGAINAATLTPLSVLPDRRKKVANSFPFKNLSSPNWSRNIGEGLALLSTLLNKSLAKALTYEEALRQTTTSTTPEFDANAFVETATNFISQNPLVIAGGVALLSLPSLLSQVITKPKPWGVESAKKVYAKLGEDETSQLLDIRPPVEQRQVGTPDITGLSKKPVAVAYKGEDKPGFLKKLALKFKEPENTTLFILDKFDGNAELVAELVTSNGFKAAYAVKDGAEGPRGWQNSGLPWSLPKKGFSFDLGNLFDAVLGNGRIWIMWDPNCWRVELLYRGAQCIHTRVTQDGSEAVSVSLGLAAAAGLGLLVFSEAETLLQLLGSAAIFQISKKLLFSEERKQNLQQVNEFLTNQIAPQELGGDIKQIGIALLPTPVISKTLPAPAVITESVPEVKPKSDINSVLTGISRPSSPYPNYPDLKPPTSPTPSQPRSSEKAESTSKVELSAESIPDINSVPKLEVKARNSKPLSPYPNYPDFKPPTSPMPSQA